MRTIPGSDRMKKLIRDVSRSRLAQQSNAEFQIEDLPGTPIVFSHWLVLILVAGEQGRISFKVHFKTSQAKWLAAPLYKRSPEELSSEQAIDCIREFCNLTAGGIKKALFPNIEMQISLPVMTRGFDEIFFTEFETPDTVKDCWRLKGPDNELICSSTINFSEDFDLSKIEINSIESAEVEFFR